ESNGTDESIHEYTKIAITLSNVGAIGQP
ncbi:MAG: hypothetical protein QG584_1973, partial [Pseudomonadota bacterium]|nr:hypothetical protein [Pseudomonadota bacterium]